MVTVVQMYTFCSDKSKAKFIGVEFPSESDHILFSYSLFISRRAFTNFGIKNWVIGWTS